MTLGKQVVPVRVHAFLDLAQNDAAFSREQVRKALLRLQPQLDGDDRLGPVCKPVHAVDDLVERPEAAVDRGVQDLDCLARLMTPPDRAIRQDVQERRAAGARGALDLLAQVVPVRGAACATYGM